MLRPGSEGTVAAAATNLGDASIEGSTTPVTIVDRLPSELTVVSVVGVAGVEGSSGPVSCVVLSAHAVSCSFAEALPAFEQIEVATKVKVAGAPEAGAQNEVAVSGGGAPSAAVKQSVDVAEAATPFGIDDYELTPENEGGSADVQAGTHPFQLTASLSFNQVVESGEYGPLPTVPALVKDLRSELSPGLVGNANAVPQCTELEFEKLAPSNVNLCPGDSAVGVASVTLNEPRTFRLVTTAVPVFNLTPALGEPARFGFEALGVPVTLDTSVRSGSDYGVTVSINNATELAAILSAQITLWGVPGDPRHNDARGWGCLAFWSSLAEENCSTARQSQPRPFLTLPTSCDGPLSAPVQADSSQEPGNFRAPHESSLQESLGGLQPGAVHAGNKDGIEHTGRRHTDRACRPLEGPPAGQRSPDRLG